MDRFGSRLLSAGRSGRITRQSWVRYRVELSDLAARPADVVLEPMTGRFVEALRRSGADERENQIRTAIRLWDSGLRHAFVWSENGEPLCMQWLLDGSHFTPLPRLGAWSGMYPPLPEGCGILENIYSFPQARERKPGAATRLAIAVMHEARRLGYRELRTHVVQTNLAAHRWARRIGLNPYGVIDRYSIKAPGLPVTYLCHHQSCAMHHLQPRHRIAEQGPGRRYP